MKNSTPRSNLDPISKTVKFSIDTSSPGRVQLAPPTGTQAKEGNQEHVIGVPPPLVGCPGASGELGSTSQKSDHHSTAMVRVLGFSGDSGFHREFLNKDVKVKTEFGMETSKAKESPQTRESERYPVYQSFGMGFNDKKIIEENRSLDFKE